MRRKRDLFDTRKRIRLQENKFSSIAQNALHNVNREEALTNTVRRTIAKTSHFLHSTEMQCDY